jgi:hypothetical protein
MKPTIGRIVHFTAQISPDEVCTFAAIVTATAADDCVSLTVFPEGAAPYTRTGVAFSEQPRLGCWSWPPRA